MLRIFINPFYVNWEVSYLDLRIFICVYLADLRKLLLTKQSKGGKEMLYTITVISITIEFLLCSKKNERKNRGQCMPKHI